LPKLLLLPGQCLLQGIQLLLDCRRIACSKSGRRNERSDERRMRDAVV
jgi:hypothetical protein